MLSDFSKYKRTFVFEKYLKSKATLKQGMPRVKLWMMIFHFRKSCCIWSMGSIKRVKVFHFMHGQSQRLDCGGQVTRTFLNSVLALSLPQNKMASQKHAYELPVVSKMALSASEVSAEYLQGIFFFFF